MSLRVHSNTEKRWQKKKEWLPFGQKKTPSASFLSINVDSLTLPFFILPRALIFYKNVERIKNKFCTIQEITPKQEPRLSQLKYSKNLFQKDNLTVEFCNYESQDLLF